MPYNFKKKDNIQLLSEQNLRKFVLPYYNLRNANMEQIKFKNTEKQRAVYKVTLFNKSYCLKKVYFKVDRLLFIYSAIEWLYRYGINVPKILPTNYNSRYVNYNNMLFILTPWIEGRKCNYDSQDDVLCAILNLSKMHNVLENFTPILGSYVKNKFDDISKSCYKHYKQLLLNSNSAFKTQDKFSLLYLEHFDINEKLGKISMKCAGSINNNNLSKSVCHLDYVNKNLIFDESNELWVIDFDKCNTEYRVHDISYFLRRYLKREKTKWNFDITIKCLDQYQRLHKLNLDEYKYILSYLTFPQKYWRISKDYFNNIENCNKKSFYKILSKSVCLEREHLKFAYKFVDYVEKKFNVHIDV